MIEVFIHILVIVAGVVLAGYSFSLADRSDTWVYSLVLRLLGAVFGSAALTSFFYGTYRLAVMDVGQ